MAPSAVQLPSDFGYVLGAAAFTGAVYLWQSFRVGAARRKYGVKYPKMYATGDDQDSNTFNCIQRSHQNSSETIGPVMVMQALLGLYHPITAASLGVAWAIGRIAYTIGYSSGDPSRIMYTIGYSSGDPAKRIPGFFVSFLCMVGLLCCGVIVGVQSVMQS
ncbi:hypothetical protein WJX84_004341 [Apatococcus fuscideae]|uniref:Microsomal glutathione S-transferase 3 n=1 Tax=Apatococcus fuscideae TaxID=2026836 RepID=A0AAW1TCY6_9CHLO